MDATYIDRVVVQSVRSLEGAQKQGRKYCDNISPETYSCKPSHSVNLLVHFKM